jgi:hypothetical protein
VIRVTLPHVGALYDGAGLGELPPHAEALCGRRHAWGVPPVTLHHSSDFFYFVLRFLQGGLSDAGWLVLQQPRQLGDVGGDPPRLVAGQ